MSPADLLFLVRRHRLVLLIALVAGVLAGWVTAPGTTTSVQMYTATHTLIGNPSSGLNLTQAALLATRGAVVEQAAAAMGENSRLTAGSIIATALTKESALTIEARDSNPARAEARANAVADSLIANLGSSATGAYDAALESLQVQADRLSAGIREGSDGSAAGDAGIVEAQEQYAIVIQQIAELQRTGSPKSALESVELATARRINKSAISAPSSKPGRAILLGGFGLLLGLGAVFALDRLDTRIHTKEGAEKAFGYPVLAEIPPLPHGAHKRELLSSSRPGSQFVEAYRGLRAHVALATESQGMRPPAEGMGPVILLTSPLAGEGKTTSVAHLAGMLGEVGRSTLVVSADFRRPRLHELFDRKRSPGLTDVLDAGPGSPDISSLNLDTREPNVQFLASGNPVHNPANVVKRTPQLLEAAQAHWEFIVVDSPPLLVATEASELARIANGVVILARTGRTTLSAAARASELLRRIEAPVLGVVLIGANENPTAYRYYRSGYYTDPDDLPWWRRLGGSSRRPKQATTTGRPNRPPTSAPRQPLWETEQQREDAAATRYQRISEERS